MVLLGWITAILAGLVVLFQFALAFGAPWGRHTMGGRARTDESGRLVAGYRVNSAVAGCVLLFTAAIVLSRSGALEIFRSDGWVGVAIWVIFGFMALNTVSNLASTSKIERFVFGAITAVCAVSTLVVAVS